MIYLQLWRDGNMIGYLPKTTLKAAERAAHVIARTGEYHPIIVAPRTETELTNA